MSAENLDLQWFAAEDEGRTEDPSEYKLRKAREEGRVPKSQDLNSSIVFLVTVLLLALTAKYALSFCVDVMRFFFVRVAENAKGDLNTSAFAMEFLNAFARIIFPIAISGGAAAIIANIVQNKGFIFTFKPISPKFSKIIPRFGEYFKNTLFSLKGAFNIVKSIGKVMIISGIAYFLIRRNIPLLIQTIHNTQLASLAKIASIAFQLLIICAVLFVIIAVPDYFVNKREFMESMKMTKYEVKQEYKEMEGDPEIKSRLEQAQRQILTQNMPKAVRESDVVITNPTHFAVSMKYDRGVDDFPKITAKGEDEIAFQMRRIATESGVPIIENRPLARSLYAEVEIGDIIPEKYLSVLAHIYTEILKYNVTKDG